MVSGPTPAQQQMVVAETCLGQVHNAGPVSQVYIYISTSTLMYIAICVGAGPALRCGHTPPHHGLQAEVRGAQVGVEIIFTVYLLVIYPSGC